MADIKNATGYVLSDLGSYYRSVTGVSGWAPASGQISYNDLRGAYGRSGPYDYNYPYYVPPNGLYHTSSYSYPSSDSNQCFYTTYGGYYFYYYTLQGNLYYRGDCFYGDVGYYTYPGGGVTAARGTCFVSAHGSNPYMPMGAIGDNGGTEICAVQAPSCSLGGWFYYYDKYSICVWAHQTGVGYDTSSYG